MFNVTTVLPHNLLQTNPFIRHNFSTQVFRKRAAQLHYVGPELRYIFWPPKEARKIPSTRTLKTSVLRTWNVSNEPKYKQVSLCTKATGFFFKKGTRHLLKFKTFINVFTNILKLCSPIKISFNPMDRFGP